MGFFKAYDMRGTFGVDFDLDTVYRVGVALPKVVEGKRWLVGRVCRVTSKAVCESLVRGLVEAGADVIDIGLCTTPMVYFFTAEDGFDGSVMVTASHNPPSDNGLKVSMRQITSTARKPEEWTCIASMQWHLPNWPSKTVPQILIRLTRIVLV